MSYKNRFVFSLVVSIPLLIEMFLEPFGRHIPGGDWGEFLLATAVMLVSAGPFIKSAWAAFKHHHANMDTLVAIGTSTAYLYSIYAMLNHQAVFYESAALVVTLILLGQVFEERMKHSANGAVKKLLDLQAKDAEVLRDGKLIRLPLDQVVMGDVIRVKPGQKIAIDGVITEGSSSIDESMVTGESMPVQKGVGDAVIGSTMNSNGTFMFKVNKLGKDTLLSQIVEMVKKAQTSHAPIEKMVDKISNIFVPAVLIISILTFMAWYVFFGATVSQALIFMVAVVIIACPCALGIATPTALMVGTGRSAKLGILIKNGETLEAANKVKTVVFDKTGTITVGKPKVTDIVGSETLVLSTAASLEKSSEHPLAGAILDRSAELKLDAKTATNFTAIEGKGVQAEVDGQMAFVGNDKLLADHQLDPSLSAKMHELQTEAKTVVIVGLNDTIIGLIAIQDAPKPSSMNAIAALRQRGLRTVMLTGDNKLVAEAIAKQVGIDEVIADVLPGDKADHVHELQKSGPVAFVGDGINDAPALTMADVGIAMGSGTDIAIESGGIVLVKNNLEDVVQALVLSEKTFSRIKMNLFWAFIYNALGIPVAAGVFAVLGLTLSPELAGLGMALSSLSVVANSLLLNKVNISTKLKSVKVGGSSMKLAEIKTRTVVIVGALYAVVALIVGSFLTNIFG